MTWACPFGAQAGGRTVFDGPEPAADPLAMRRQHLLIVDEIEREHYERELVWRPLERLEDDAA